MGDDSIPAAVRVRLFARYAELLGTDLVEIPAAAAPTVAAVVGRIRALPGGRALPEQPMVAVNLTHVRGDRPLNPGDEVALLPPLAGG